VIQNCGASQCGFVDDNNEFQCNATCNVDSDCAPGHQCLNDLDSPPVDCAQSNAGGCHCV
jgi:hypothetical protein